MTINRQITGSSRSAIPAPVPKPKLNIVGTIAETGSVNSWYSFAQDPNDPTYIYGAHGNGGGIDVIDVTDVTAPVVVANVALTGHARGVGITGTTLCGCSRDSSDGYFYTWDATTPASIVDTPQDTVVGTEDKYSELAMDGTDVYVAGQISGAWKFDISNPAIVSDPPTAGPAPVGDDWETQGVTVSGSYVYFANYDTGLRILTKADMGVTTDNEVAVPTLNGKDVRPWNCVINGNYLYCCTNTVGAANDIERGLAILDITTPATASVWTVAAIGSQDVDIWNGAGDKPILGIVHHGDYVYLTNGQKGIAVFHVADPTRPSYMGLLTGHDAGDNLHGINKFTLNGKTYLIYGDGLRATTTDGTNKLYIGELTV